MPNSLYREAKIRATPLTVAGHRVHPVLGVGYSHGMHALLLSLVLSVGTDEPAEAWAEWGLGETALESLDGVLTPAYGLSLESQIRKDQLDRARAVVGTLDLAIERLRRGLKAPRCSKPDFAVLIRIDRLATAAIMRALLAAEDREDPSPLVLNLVDLARRVARCHGGLDAIAEGLKLEVSVQRSPSVLVALA